MNSDYCRNVNNGNIACGIEAKTEEASKWMEAIMIIK